MVKLQQKDAQCLGREKDFGPRPLRCDVIMDHSCWQLQCAVAVVAAWRLIKAHSKVLVGANEDSVQFRNAIGSLFRLIV